MEVKDIEFENDVIVIKMEVNQLPKLSVDRQGKFIKWGVDNNYPEKRIIHCYNNHPEHGSIVKGKARYISGTAILPSIDTPDVHYFLAKPNRYENFHSLGKKVAGDKVLYGGFAIQVNPNILGRPVEYFHLDMGKLRPHENKTGFWYSEDWGANKWDIKKSYFPIYQDGIKETSIYIYKDHAPSVNKFDSILPVPEYSSVLLDIDTDIEISNFFNMLVKNGFSAGHIITFFNGKFTPEKKKEIEERFQHKFNGTDNAGKVVIVFTNPDGKGTQVTNITPNGLSEQYDTINKRNENKIVRGHNVPRALFKMETEGSLGDRTVLDLQHELFINEYAKIEQDPFNQFLKKMYKASRGIDCDFSVEQVESIGVDWLNPAVNKYLTNDEAREKLGLPAAEKSANYEAQKVTDAINALSPLVANKVLESMDPDEIRALVGLKSKTAPVLDEMGMPVKESVTNPALMNLTGRQRQGLDAIVRKFKQGKYDEHQALMHIAAFGFNEEDSKKYLGIYSEEIENELPRTKMKREKSIALLEFIKLNTIEISEDDELIDSRPYSIQFANEGLKKEDGNLVPKKSFLQGLIDSFKKKINPDEYDTEVYTVYKYALRPELAAKGEPMFLATSRDRCHEFADMTSGNSRLTFEAIDALNNDMETDNDNAWDYRGGFWGKKKACRHIWMAETRIKKIKK